MGDVFSLLADWLVARSRAWETNQELFELTKRARSRLGNSDAGGQRALGIFPVEVVFQKHICGATKDCSVCSALRVGRFYSAVQDSLDRLDHFRAGVWVDSVSFARYSDVRLSRVSGDVKLFIVTRIRCWCMLRCLLCRFRLLRFRSRIGVVVDLL